MSGFGFFSDRISESTQLSRCSESNHGKMYRSNHRFQPRPHRHLTLLVYQGRKLQTPFRQVTAKAPLNFRKCFQVWARHLPSSLLFNFVYCMCETVRSIYATPLDCKCSRVNTRLACDLLQKLLCNQKATFLCFTTFYFALAYTRSQHAYWRLSAHVSTKNFSH